MLSHETRLLHRQSHAKHHLLLSLILVQLKLDGVRRGEVVESKRCRVYHVYLIVLVGEELLKLILVGLICYQRAHVPCHVHWRSDRCCQRRRCRVAYRHVAVSGSYALLLRSVQEFVVPVALLLLLRPDVMLLRCSILIVFYSLLLG